MEGKMGVCVEFVQDLASLFKDIAAQFLVPELLPSTRRRLGRRK
jgi:hypothetical protein